MSTYDISKIQLPNGDTCNLKDSNAVHKTDYATSSNAGVVSVYSGDGISISNGAIYINRADNSQIKAGENRLRPIVPYNQHQAVFYGLTKAAGVDMASSNNAVGTYTDEAKGAIQNMLGINNMIAPIQTNTLAIQAYSVNDLFWYNGKLYKATAAIAQNGNIIVGTNCIETKLTDNYISKSIGTVEGDMIYYSDNATPSRLEIGNQGQVLKVNSDGLPYWNNENVAEYKTLTDQEVATFDDGVQNSVLKSYSVKIEPKQDLHGYNKPWVCGCGKNKLRMILSEVKAANNTWTWNGNSAQKNGITVNIETDNADNIIGYNATGTASANVWFVFRSFDAGELPIDGSLKFGGYLSSPGNVSSTYGYQLYFKNNNGQNIISSAANDYNSISNSISTGDTSPNYASIVFRSGTSITNLMFKPMILLTTETDTTYEPYSNICPIEGWNEVEVTRTGKNLIDPSTLTTGKAIDASGQIVSSGGYLYSKLIPVNPNTGYTFSLRTTDTTASLWARRVHAYDFDGNWLSQLAVLPNMAQTGIRYSSSFVTSSTTRYLRVSYAGTYGVDVDAQIEVGSTATTYEPYIGQTTSINVKSINNNNTVYGGTLTINEDGGGELIVTKKILYVEDILDASFTSATASNDLTRFWLYDSQSLTYNHEIKSDFLYHVSTVPEKGEVYAISTYPSSMQIGMPSALVGTTLESIRDYFKTNKNHTDNYFILDLKNPITYSLTSSQIKALLGTNTIWSEAGKITITYPVNLKGYIDSINNNLITNMLGMNTSSYKTIKNQTIASFDDGIEGAPLKSCIVNIEPKQDLHGYDKPWPAGYGKNLCPVNTITGQNAITNVTCNIPAGSYIISYSSPDTHHLSFRFYHTRGDDNDSTVILAQQATGTTVTFSKDVVSINVIIAPVDSDTITINNIQIEAGSTATSYEPYSNICPIEGYDTVEVVSTGKNLLDNTKCVNRTFSGITRTVQQDKSIILDGTSTTSSQWYSPVDTPILTLPPGTYTVSCEVNFRLQSTKNGLNQYTPSLTNGSATFTINEITTFNNARFDIGTGTTANNLVVHPQLECGSTATPYEPFGSITSLSIARAAGGTVYGGTLTVNEDGSGTLVVDRAYYTGSDFDQTAYAANNGFNAYRRYHCLSPANDHDAICNMFDESTNLPFSSSNMSRAQYRVVADNTTIYAVLPDGINITDLKISYRIASPVSYQLTTTQLQTLVGENHIWANTGNITITYPTNLKGYIDSINTNINNNLVKNTDTIPVNQGGTGTTSFAADCAIVGNGTSTMMSKGLKITGAINDNIILQPYTNGKTLTIKTTSGSPMNISSNNTLYLDAAINASQIFRKGTTEFARFNVNGKLQLGGYTGTQNTHELFVNGNSAFNGKIAFGTTSGNDIVEKAYMQYNTTDNSIDFIFV